MLGWIAKSSPFLLRDLAIPGEHIVALAGLSNPASLLRDLTIPDERTDARLDCQIQPFPAARFGNPWQADRCLAGLPSPALPIQRQPRAADIMTPHGFLEVGVKAAL